MSQFHTVFGSLDNFEKGRIEIINDDPKNYAFSNVFEVAAKSPPYQKVAVGKNEKNLIEAIRAEGSSPWYTCAHDEFALVMDGEVEVHFIDIVEFCAPPGVEGGKHLAQGRTAGQEDGVRGAETRASGVAARQRRLSVPRQEDRRDSPAGA